VFINYFIAQLKMLRNGCHIASLFISCVLYADDILLLSSSVAGLQQMLEKCTEVANLLSLTFKVNKSHCV